MQRSIDEKFNIQHPAAPWLAAAGETWQTAFDGYTRWNARLVEALSSYQDGYATFVNQRVQDITAFPARLAACKSPFEIAYAYGNLLTTAAADYQKQCLDLVDIGRSANASLQDRRESE